MHDLGVLMTFAGSLAGALVLGFLAHRLELSPIVGYLLTVGLLLLLPILFGPGGRRCASVGSASASPNPRRIECLDPRSSGQPVACAVCDRTCPWRPRFDSLRRCLSGTNPGRCPTKSWYESKMDWLGLATIATTVASAVADGDLSGVVRFAPRFAGVRWPTD